MMWNGLLDIRNLFHEHDMIGVYEAATAELDDTSFESMQFMLLDRVRKVLQSVAYGTTSAALDYGPPRILTQLIIATEVIKHKKACEAEYQWGLKARTRMAERYTRILHCDISQVSP